MADINLKAAEHYLKVHTYLNKKKANIVDTYDVRSDYKQVLVLQDYDKGELKALIRNIRLGNKSFQETRIEEEKEYLKQKAEI